MPYGAGLGYAVRLPGEVGLSDPNVADGLEQATQTLRVQKAFQQVLDDPAAQKVLQDTALRPLLAEAAD